ncbi:glycosyltransferase family 2 protein [Nanoarchaeota archaeon]
MTKTDKILLFVPCLNAEKTIAKVLDRIRTLKFQYDILIVDNNSPDRTLKVVRKYVDTHNLQNCKVIRNVENIGYGGSQKFAFWYGIYHRYDYMIILHSDGQYPIEHSGKLIKKIKESKSNVVFGSRVTHKGVRKTMPKWRFLGNRILSGFDRWAFNLNLSEFHSEFKIYDLKFMSRIDMNRWGHQENQMMHILISILSHKGKISEISIPCDYHKDAHHPKLLNLFWYAAHTFYRGLRYKLFRF